MSLLRGLGLGYVAAVAGLVVSACAASPRASAPDPARSAAPPPKARVASPPDRELVPSLDALAARGATDAPLMREVLRVDRALPRSPDVRADKDLCVRALFAASSSVRAFFAEASGAPRGEAASGASAAAPPRGPVCMKKGEALHLVIESGDAGAPTARAVIFAAP